MDDHYEDLNYEDEDPYFYEDPDDISVPLDEDDYGWDPD